MHVVQRLVSAKSIDTPRSRFVFRTTSSASVLAAAATLSAGSASLARNEQADARRMQAGSLGVIQHLFHPRPHSARIAAITAYVLHEGPQFACRTQQFHAGIARRRHEPLTPVLLGLTDFAYHQCGLRDQRPDEAGDLR